MNLPAIAPSKNKLLKRELLTRALASRNLDTFASYIKPDFITNWFTHYLHDTIQEFVDQSIAKKSPRLILTTPPRHGKTQAVTRALAAFLPAYVPKSQSIFVTHTDKLTADNGADTRAIIESPEYANVFPECELDPEHRSREDMRFTNGSRIKFTSIGSGLPGYGGEVIVVDDYFRNNDEAESLNNRDAVFNWLRGTLFNRIHPGGGVIITATRWHVDDPIGRLLKDHAAHWPILEFPAIAKVTDNHRSAGDCLHPRWDLTQLAIMRREAGERVFASLYQCSPYLETGNFFKIESLQWYDTVPTNTANLVGADYATSDSTHADHTAIIPAHLDQNDCLYVSADYVYEKMEPRKAVLTTVKLCKQFKTYILCHEKGVIAKLLRPLFEDAYNEERYYLITERYARTAGKHVYALNIQGRIDAGKIKFPRSRKEEITRLLSIFDPKSDHEDDFVDALASVCLAVSKAVIRPRPDLPDLPTKVTHEVRISNEAKDLLRMRDDDRANSRNSESDW